MQQIIYSRNVAADLPQLLGGLHFDRLFLLTDENTHRLCRPLLKGSSAEQAESIVIGATDENKTPETLMAVWQALCNGGATRHSLLICLGGGMVTDLGGFAAATFKRGIKFVNIPTTLLSMVDAAVGGKTGINFNGLKNEIGAFREADAVIVSTDFLHTLDDLNMCSGYAEMLKHALLDGDRMWAEHLNFDVYSFDFSLLPTLVKESIVLKQRVVQEDPHEQGLRKALNLGHTVGHAFESLALQRQTAVFHGYAVAWGLVCELFLSTLFGFPVEKMRQTFAFIREHYGRFNFTCDDYETLYAYMQHDKKNMGGHINFTLLEDVGRVKLDCRVSKEDVFAAFDFLREG